MHAVSVEGGRLHQAQSTPPPPDMDTVLGFCNQSVLFLFHLLA